jgi:hypothetical protein
MLFATTLLRREATMPEMLFCYCCRVHHPRDQMHSFATSQGLRWRCQRSIDAAKCSASERDAFGKKQTAINREAALEVAKRIYLGEP